MFLIFVLRNKGNKTKERIKEEETGKDDYGPTTRKVSLTFSRTSEPSKAVPNHLADESGNLAVASYPRPSSAAAKYPRKLFRSCKISVLQKFLRVEGELTWCRGKLWLLITIAYLSGPLSITWLHRLSHGRPSLRQARRRWAPRNRHEESRRLSSSFSVLQSH